MASPAEEKVECKRLRRLTEYRKPISPEIGSLYDILHDHATIPLYVLPIGWTELHKQLLGCHFVQLPPQATPIPSGSVSSRIRPLSYRAPREIIDMGRDIDTIMGPGIIALMKTQAVRNVLETAFPGRFSPMASDLTIWCGGKQYTCAVRCQAMWKKACESDLSDLPTLHSVSSTSTYGSNASESSFASKSENGIIRAPFDTPVLGYLNLDYLNHVRRKCYRIQLCPDGSPNIPIQQLHQLRSRKLIPQKPLEDQYILAIALAMAQQHAYASISTQEGFAPKNIPVRILVTSEAEATFIVYSCVVPIALLTLFHEPAQTPLGDLRVIIRYQHVPVWPILGLKERLGQALGKDIVGDFDEFHINTFEKPQSDSDDGSGVREKEMTTVFKELANRELVTPIVPQVTSPKHKREILSEVFNASFSEDRDSHDYPSELLAKRRCLEEGRIGVVR